MKKTKLCLNAMLGNEEHIVERMLNSCYKYIDYWIIQCNGNDRTQEIIEEFFVEKNIPGFTYTTEWKYPGWNSDHLIQKCNQADHGCDWFFRIDGDEQLQVDDDFDWSVLEDISVDSWNVVATTDASSWYRCRLWNTKISWKFRHDKRHECILKPGCGPTEEEFPRLPLDKGFRHYIISDGNSYTNPTKFLKDAIELEEQHVCGETLLDDMYHFWYLAKSYHDAIDGKYPLGDDHCKEYARRSIFYFKQYLNHKFNYDKVGTAPYIDEGGYYSMVLIGNLYLRCGDYQRAIHYYVKAEEFCPERNEHLCRLAETFDKLNDYSSMLKCTTILVQSERKNPFPKYQFFINNNSYYDTGNYVKYLHNIALTK